MENSKTVLKDIEEFLRCTNELGSKVNNAGIEWKDSKYDNIKTEIGKLSTGTLNLTQAGEECQKNIKIFESYIKE